MEIDLTPIDLKLTARSVSQLHAMLGTLLDGLTPPWIELLTES